MTSAATPHPGIVTFPLAAPQLTEIETTDDSGVTGLGPMYPTFGKPYSHQRILRPSTEGLVAMTASRWGCVNL